MDYLLLIAVLPSILLGKYIYGKDKIEKEPTGLLIKLFIGGILAILLTLILSDISELLFPTLTSEDTNIKTLLINNFIGVALIEEACKWIMLKLLTWKNKNFNYLFDGIVYAVFVALGFATVENLMYIFLSDNYFFTAIFRAILSVPGHAFFGVFMGYYYGMAKLNKNQGKSYIFNLLFSIIVPMILHGIFDFCLSIDSLICIAIYVLFVMVLYISAIKKIKHLSNNDININ